MMQNQITTEETPQSPLTPPAVQPEECTTEATTDTHTAQAIKKRLEKMQREARYIKTLWRMTRVAFGVVLPLLMLCAVFVDSRFLRHFFAQAVALTFGIATSMIISSVGFLTFASGEKAEELAKFGGIKAIGPLMEALDNPFDTSNRLSILAALCLLLPRLKASDALLLNRRQRDILHRELRVKRYLFDMPAQRADFCIAALKALEQVGDERAIPVVTRLANLKSRRPNNRRVQQAAIECLPMLQANLETVQSNQTLLRASEPSASPETLLRPAASAPSEQSKQLLRPH